MGEGAIVVNARLGGLAAAAETPAREPLTASTSVAAYDYLVPFRSVDFCPNLRQRAILHAAIEMRLVDYS
jgi:hypothetical protein